MEHEIWKCDIMCLDFWRRLLDVTAEKEFNYRFKAIEDDEMTQWDELFEPVEAYIESGACGPVAKWDVEWIEVDPIMEENKEWVDYTDYLCKKLTAEGFEYEITNHFIRINTALKW